MVDNKRERQSLLSKPVLWLILGLIVFIAVVSFICYVNIDTSAKISSFFSFVSTFGIIATISIYFFQKNDYNTQKENERKEIEEQIKLSLISACYINDYILSYNLKLLKELHEKNVPTNIFDVKKLILKYEKKNLDDILYQSYSINPKISSIIHRLILLIEQTNIKISLFEVIYHDKASVFTSEVMDVHNSFQTEYIEINTNLSDIK